MVRAIRCKFGRDDVVTGRTPSLWHTHIPTYAQVRYRNVYPGIDLVYYGRNGAPEYDFVVRPGADLARIRLMVRAESNGRSAPAALDNHGNLTVRLPGAGVVQQAPVIYQQQGSRRIRIAGHFTLNTGQLGLRLAAYDQAHPLVIDPTLVYSTYLGGSGDDDEGAVIAVDGQGNAYLTGSTDSSNFPLGRPFDAHYGGHGDIYVTALSTDGRTLRYSTYLGGGREENGSGIAVDGQGNAYVTGFTESGNFPLRRPLRGSFGGGTADAFVAKISSS